jgi:hypothetical protein
MAARGIANWFLSTILHIIRKYTGRFRKLDLFPFSGAGVYSLGLIRNS